MSGKNLGQREIHRDLSGLNSERHWVCDDSCPEHAADLVVAPKNVAGNYTTTIEWGAVNKKVPARPDPNGPGYWGKRVPDPQPNPKVDAYERQINPNNESYYLPNGKGSNVQFENLQGKTLQDGKFVGAQGPVESSPYRVADTKPFLRESVKKEALRQVEAAEANGLTVEWLVSDQVAANQLIAFFKQEGINIKVTYLAPK